MFELLLLVSGIAVGGLFLILFVKLLVALVLIPVKVGFFLLKGVLGLIIAVPVILVGFVVCSVVLPLVLGLAVPLVLLLGIPLLLGGLVVAGLVKLVF
ncbi:MAG: hypothetical protein ACE5JX_04495 [Acidobacteriota bacterium]